MARIYLTDPAQALVEGAGVIFPKKTAMKILSPKNLKNEKGFTLIELLVVIAIIGILASIAIPQFAQYRARSNAAQVETDLHNVYLSCKAFWGTGTNNSNSACTPAAIAGPLYGFTSTTGVTAPLITTGTEAGFVATATHPAVFDADGTTVSVFDVDATGAIGNTGGY